jgi:hypothetical protein
MTSKGALNGAIIRIMKPLAFSLSLLLSPLAVAGDLSPWWAPSGEVANSAWVPVFVLGDNERPLYPVIDAEPSSPEGVMIGLAQVTRDHPWFGPSVSTGANLSWSMTDSIRFGSSVTVTDFVPCRSLMQAPLAPVHSDPCSSFSGVDASATLDLGTSSFSVGMSESPAIWVLPGQIAGARDVGQSLSTALSLLPSLSLANDTAQTLYVAGEVALSPLTTLGVSLARSELPMLDNSPDLDRMQLRLAYGDFSADMATMMIRQGMDSVSPWWAGLDLGVSWRTPWSGILSVGAQNLITKGQRPEMAQPTISDREPDIFSRTPYVRYEQDF